MSTNQHVALTLRVPRRLLADLGERAGEAGISRHRFGVAALSRAARSTPASVMAFREVVLTPNGSSTVDNMLEWLCARRPSVVDLADESGALSPKLRRALFAALPASQARRMEQRLRGVSYEEIGHHEGASKQAVQQSVMRAQVKLGKSVEFVQALCDAFPDSGLTPTALMEAAGDR